ncbi:4-hydroxy-tetrahydrodipicolinate reductase [Dyella sp.]|jgi:4-hydroxy-tetrahydrodipicolinate reductase|uniref:4-hydroxy-tetrahydrodipicolinate reductase n=1 Tax=Dyella sp. TaxID=1869338 RepID=UPI002D7947DC|nr:4-hydroxy-tetrahydrodipicolinate reductase [Dyella sp.]HET6433156.1 4-hydroxy-tetrahydrodipicolinate reductase [Dyella sp.]
MGEIVRVAVNGATGRMGRVLLDLLRRDRRFALVGALTAPDSPEMGAPVAHGSDLCFTHDWSRLGPVDVVIDFSGPEGFAAALAHCRETAAALVTGTTGLDAQLKAQLDQASARIACLHSANFSLGVAVLSRLLREAAAALPEWDLEIVEAHHGRKEDAPSGTALALGEVAASARSVLLTEQAVHAREGHTGPRRAGSIGFAVVRGGDVVGEHSALLLGLGERIELSHRATDRSIFARGAIEAAHWLAGKPPGCYALDAMLAERLPR